MIYVKKCCILLNMYLSLQLQILICKNETVLFIYPYLTRTKLSRDQRGQMTPFTNLLHVFFLFIIM